MVYNDIKVQYFTKTHSQLWLRRVVVQKKQSTKDGGMKGCSPCSDELTRARKYALGTEVAGTHRYLRASSERPGRVAAFCFHHCNTKLFCASHFLASAFARTLKLGDFYLLRPPLHRHPHRRQAPRSAQANDVSGGFTCRDS